MGARKSMRGRTLCPAVRTCPGTERTDNPPLKGVSGCPPPAKPSPFKHLPTLQGPPSSMPIALFETLSDIVADVLVRDFKANPPASGASPRGSARTAQAYQEPS